MTSIHANPFRPVPRQPQRAVHSPAHHGSQSAASAAVDSGPRPGNRPGASPGNTPGIYLPARVDDCHARMASDPANAGAIYQGFLRQVRQLLPGAAQNLRRLPLLSSPQDIRRQLRGIGPRLAEQARQSGQGAILLSGHLRGAGNEVDSFQASLREARAAGIGRLVIEQPPGMADLDARFGFPVQQLIHQGQPEQLKALFRQSGVRFTRTLESFVGAAKNVQDARRQGMQVMLIDLAHLGATSSDGRNAALAETLMDMAATGQGVMAAVPAFGVADLTSLIGLSGTPVEGVAYLSDTPEGTLCMGQYDTGNRTRLPNLSVLRLPEGPLAGRGPGQARRHPPQRWQAEQPGRPPQPGVRGQRQPPQAQHLQQRQPQQGFQGMAPQGWPGGDPRRQRGV